jgi:polar amino acid transport system substrate-binding protein
MNKKLIISTAILLVSSSAFSAQEITLCYENVTVFPWITGDDQGVGISELHLVEKKTAVKFKMVRLPWKRCQLEAQKGNFDGIISASFNDERATWGVYPFSEKNKIEPDYRMHTDSFYIYTRKDGPIHWKNGKLLNLGDNKVGVQLGYSVGNELIKQGYPIHSNFTSAVDLIKEIDRGIVQVAVLQDHEATHVLSTITELGKRIVRNEPAFKIADQYLLFTKTFFNHNQELSKKIWKAFSSVREGQDYKTLVENELKNL